MLLPNPHTHTRRAMLAATLAAGLGALALAGCHKPAPPGAIDAGETDYALKVLANAPAEGFAPEAFGARRLAELGRDKSRRAERDTALHAAILAYARAEHGLAIPGKAMPPAWGL